LRRGTSRSRARPRPLGAPSSQRHLTRVSRDDVGSRDPLVAAHFRAQPSCLGVVDTVVSGGRHSATSHFARSGPAVQTAPWSGPLCSHVSASERIGRSDDGGTGDAIERRRMTPVPPISTLPDAVQRSSEFCASRSFPLRSCALDVRPPAVGGPLWRITFPQIERSEPATRSPKSLEVPKRCPWSPPAQGSRPRGDVRQVRQRETVGTWTALRRSGLAGGPDSGRRSR
jgi:hypothetical protein